MPRIPPGYAVLERLFRYSGSLMRYVSFLLLIVLTVTVLGPGSFLVSVPCEENGDVLETMDVCHRSAPALSTGGEMPCVQCSSCLPQPLLSVRAGFSPSPLFGEFIVISVKEHPPESLR